MERENAKIEHTIFNLFNTAKRYNISNNFKNVNNITHYILKKSLAEKK